jgi:hypothetical protein
MTEFIRYGNEMLNMALVIAVEFHENDGDKTSAILIIDFAAPSLNALNQPGGSVYRRIYHGSQAKDIWKYLCLRPMATVKVARI